MSDSERWMLPTHVRPVRFDLTLEPDLTSFTFSGRQTVEIEVVEPNRTVVMNSAEINISSCRLTLADGTELRPEVTDLDTAKETVSFRFDRSLPKGFANLALEFTGELNDRLRGFYRSHYKDSNGRDRYLATTQFEATDARRAFPCWDEPSWKASYKITLVVPADMTAISNMQIVNETVDRDRRKTVNFAETPVMSTYILAFVVGDLNSIEQRTPNDTLIRIWTTPGKEEQGRFALETSVRLLDYFNDYFGIPYPLKKLDHLAIPDFAAGAMENWGAITYRETALLVDPENSSAGTRQIVAAIISHEMAHMWFGDLVTMAWWNDLWLNESFASWMGDKAVNDLFPDWEMWTQFVSSDTNTALSLDGLKNSHPIEQEVNNPAQIQEMFDAISYSKGAAIIRMLEQFLGPDKFQDGLHRYLSDHKYGNAETRDLWDALGSASGEPVAEMMDTWTGQMGYPVLNMESSSLNERTAITISQKRFIYEDMLGKPEEDDSLWKVPVSVRTSDIDKISSTLMSARTDTISIPSQKRPTWIKLNPEQTGFYRVNYSTEDIATLTKPISSKQLTASDRLGIQNDAFALSKAGHAPATRFLTVARSYFNENNAPVVSDLSQNLAALDSLLANEPYHRKFQAFARNIFAPIGQRVGWDARTGEGHLDSLLRSTVMEALGRYEDPDTLNEAFTRLDSYATDPTTVDPDIRRAVFSLAAKQGDASTWEALWGLYQDATLQEEKVRLLVSMTQFKQPDLLQMTLERSMSDDVRSQDAIYGLVGTGGNVHGRDLAWEFVKNRWDEIYQRYGEGGFMIMRLVSLTSGFSTQEKLLDVEKFFASHPAPAAERSIRQSLERIRLNIAWLAANRTDLTVWFTD